VPPPRKPADTRWGVVMTSRLYTCVCGFAPLSIASQKRHRKVCADWRDREDPRGLMLSRRRESLHRPLEVSRCDVCKRRLDHHAPSCPQSSSAANRRETLERAGLNETESRLLIAALKLLCPKGVTKN